MKLVLLLLNSIISTLYGMNHNLPVHFVHFEPLQNRVSRINAIDEITQLAKEDAPQKRPATPLTRHIPFDSEPTKHTTHLITNNAFGLPALKTIALAMHSQQADVMTTSPSIKEVSRYTLTHNIIYMLDQLIYWKQKNQLKNLEDFRKTIIARAFTTTQDYDEKSTITKLRPSDNEVFSRMKNECSHALNYEPTIIYQSPHEMIMKTNISFLTWVYYIQQAIKQNMGSEYILQLILSMETPLKRYNSIINNKEQMQKLHAAHENFNNLLTSTLALTNRSVDIKQETNSALLELLLVIETAMHDLLQMHPSTPSSTDEINLVKKDLANQTKQDQIITKQHSNPTIVEQVKVTTETIRFTEGEQKNSKADASTKIESVIPRASFKDMTMTAMSIALIFGSLYLYNQHCLQKG